MVTVKGKRGLREKRGRRGQEVAIGKAVGTRPS